MEYNHADVELKEYIMLVCKILSLYMLKMISVGPCAAKWM